MKANPTHSPAQATLPEAIQNYLAAANDGRVDDAAACFADDALVHDENRDRQGAEAIRQWIADSTREYQPQNEVLSVTGDGDAHLVVSKISGNFPGSPIELGFRYVVTHGKISHLSIQ